MKNQKLIRFVQSVILLPTLTISMPNGAFTLGNPQNAHIVTTYNTVLQQKPNTALETLAFNQVIDSKAQMLKMQADAIDAYFGAHDMPVYGLGMKMAEEADTNGLDWRLLLAIAVRESTGGKDACDKATHNFFGWGSCKISFSSDEQAIETLAMNLGGNNPSTAKHYDNKTTKQILRAYNPPYVVPRYAEQVMAIMDSIGPADLGVVSANG